MGGWGEQATKKSRGWRKEISEKFKFFEKRNAPARPRKRGHDCKNNMNE
jgi:hypothetical protein